MLRVIARELRTLGDMIEGYSYRDIVKTGVRLPIYKELPKPFLLRRNHGTIIDVGANVGQFSATVRHLFPSAVIYAFGPLPDCFESLQTRFAEKTNIRCANVALGAAPGTLTFYRNVYSSSSSFFETTQRQVDAFPCTHSSTPVTVDVRTLDELLPEMSITPPLLIKIDVQGYESLVIDGAIKALLLADTIIVETSYVELYRGQALFGEIYNKLITLGFVYAGALEQSLAPDSGEVLQSDAVFFSGKR